MIDPSMRQSSGVRFTVLFVCTVVSLAALALLLLLANTVITTPIAFDNDEANHAIDGWEVFVALRSRVTGGSVERNHRARILSARPLIHCGRSLSAGRAGAGIQPFAHTLPLWADAGRPGMDHLSHRTPSRRRQTRAV